ncbi:hypothetical protein BH23GEM3_BH23GEM3_12630 [soil metagenome]|nr:hypothetical protein [Gemmatimonadota bacterium]
MNGKPSLAALAAVTLLAGCATPAQPPPTADPSGGITIAKVRALGVEMLPGPVPTYHTPGYAERARTLQRMVEEGRRFFADSLELRADVNLAILGEAEWARLTPVPYTIPFFSPGASLIFLPATTAGPIVDDYLASEPRLPAARLQQIERAGFSFEDGAHTMVDLIGYHELGHLYTPAYGIQPPGHWVNEFLATYFAYAYLRRAQPRLAELWDGMVQPAPDSRPPHTSLADFDRLYFGVGPENYFWYQGTFAARVSEVFAERGLGFLVAVREAFPAGADTPQTADEVLNRFERIHPGFIAWAASLESAVVRSAR